MPTGNTEGIIGRCMTFPEFLWKCARSMGALIHMKEDHSDAPITKPGPSSSYEKKVIRDARRDLKKLKNSTYAQIERHLRRHYRHSLASWKSLVEERNDRWLKYEDMRAQVQAWEPPTSDHQGLKDYMLRQIQDSVDFDCGLCPEPKLQDPADYLKSEIEFLTGRISKYEAILREKNKMMDAGEWIDKLHVSVPSPTGKPKREKKIR